MPDYGDPAGFTIASPYPPVAVEAPYPSASISLVPFGGGEFLPATTSTSPHQFRQSTTDTVVDNLSCDLVRVGGSPPFQADGLPYKQGITAREMSPSVIPAPRDNSDITTLLRNHLDDGDDTATTPETYRTSRRLTQQHGFQLANVHHAYARGASGAGVRIAIYDTPVDIRHWDLRGRVAYEGSRVPLAMNHAWVDSPYNIQRSFRHCLTAADAAENNCSVWEINAGGDPQIISDYARDIIERFDYAHQENTWWIRDTSQNGDDAWFEIPPLFDCEDRSAPRPQLATYQPCLEYRHGTFVATVAAGWNFGVAPGAHVVPISQEVGDPWDQPSIQRYTTTALWNRLQNRMTPVQRQAYDGRVAERLRTQYANFDVMNVSVGDNFAPDSPGAFDSDLRTQRWLPQLWRALQQLDTPAEHRVIEVHAAGNERGKYPNQQNLWDQPSGESARPWRFAEFRGHQLAVVAVDPNPSDDNGDHNDNYGKIADYSNWCGAVPAGWDAEMYGRHYCLAAPGTLTAFDIGWRGQPGENAPAFIVSGTSFAAPVVSGAVALLMQYFTDGEGTRQLGNTEIVRRIVNTANNRGEYSRSDIYGAGLLDLQAATEPVGPTTMGNATITALAAQSSIALPRAYGDVARRLRHVNVATFDSWNAPFFRPASHFITGATLGTHSMVPRFDTAAPTPQMLITKALGLVRSPTATPITPHGYTLLAHRTGLGLAWPATQNLEFGAVADTASDQGARVSGAFGKRVRSAMLWSQFAQEFQLHSQWTGWLAASVGAGQPEYISSMLELGAATYSTWEVGLRNESWRMSLAQPWRAESGHGQLQYTTGRLQTGEHLFDTQDFTLAPRGRELALRVGYTRTIGLGEMKMELSQHHDFGHVPEAEETRIGLAWQWRW